MAARKKKKTPVARSRQALRDLVSETAKQLEKSVGTPSTAKQPRGAPVSRERIEMMRETVKRGRIKKAFEEGRTPKPKKKKKRKPFRRRPHETIT